MLYLNHTTEKNDIDMTEKDTLSASIERQRK